MRAHKLGTWLGLCLGVFVLGAGEGWAWGARGHRTVNAAAATLMTSPGAAFFQANSRFLSSLATVPDYPWKVDNRAGEGNLHFCDYDVYLGSAAGSSLGDYDLERARSALGSDLVDHSGAVIWRVEQIYSMLVDALRQGDWTRSIQLAGVLGHYAGDLSQPMHNTSDYDGQSIHKHGIHAYFETSLVNTVDPDTLISDAATNAAKTKRELVAKRPVGRPFSGEDARRLALQEAQESASYLEGLLTEFDTETPDDAQLTTHFGPWMGRGAAYLAELWDLAVLSSGQAAFPSEALSDVSIPEWFSVDDASYKAAFRR